MNFCLKRNIRNIDVDKNKLTSKHRNYNPANNLEIVLSRPKMSWSEFLYNITGAKNIKYNVYFIHFGSSFAKVKIIYTHSTVICWEVHANQNLKPWKL